MVSLLNQESVLSVLSVVNRLSASVDRNGLFALPIGSPRQSTINSLKKVASRTCRESENPSGPHRAQQRRLQPTPCLATVP